MAAIALTGRSQFDGFDPVTFEHTDTFDSSRNRLAAGRLWTEFGDGDSPGAGVLVRRCSAHRTETISTTTLSTGRAERVEPSTLRSRGPFQQAGFSIA